MTMKYHIGVIEIVYGPPISGSKKKELGYTNCGKVIHPMVHNVRFWVLSKERFLELTEHKCQNCERLQ